MEAKPSLQLGNRQTEGFHGAAGAREGKKSGTLAARVLVCTVL